jgi:hypothetical protein
MRNALLALSAIGILGLSMPLTAPARADEKVVIKDHRDHPRFLDRFRHRDHFFGRARHHDDKEVIIKKHDDH